MGEKKIKKMNLNRNFKISTQINLKTKNYYVCHLNSATTTPDKNIATSKNEPTPWSPPQLDTKTPSPIFGGSTGGLMRKAQVEEFYVITWDSKKELIFEMPTGGSAIMRQGSNLLKFARKEQCLALTTQLRTKFKTNSCFYRVFPNGEVQYLHPADGVYPEKVNKGRKGANQHMRRIGQNTQPAKVKFTGKGTMEI